MKKYMVFSIFLGLVFFMPYTAFAEVAGLCVNCHTMHHSQTPWPAGWGSGDPNPALLVNDCVGCHSSATSSTFYDLDGCKVPVVFYTASEPTEYLAGGNFYWVAQTGGDAKGHNVLGISGQDTNLSEAPGNENNCGNSCHSSLTTTNYNAPGCQGCHLKVKHHASDHANGDSGLVGCEGSCTVEEANGWYRFLSGHNSGNLCGVRGYEHGLWEAGQPNLGTGNADNHNEYLGWEGHLEWQAGFYNLGNTMTAFCCGCHGNFHKEQASGQWIRHPSDAVIPNTAGSEYADTGGGLYDPLSPVARPTVDGTPDGTVNPGTDMVMCLSCHRPHGSPYPDLLRWDYTTQLAGGGGDDKGCFYCHTKKNDP